LLFNSSATNSKNPSKSQYVAAVGDSDLARVVLAHQPWRLPARLFRPNRSVPDERKLLSPHSHAPLDQVQVSSHNLGRVRRRIHKAWAK
jgi:hypothetical protein